MASSTTAQTTPEQPQDLRSWFEGVVSQNYKLLFATAYRQLGDVQDSEDAVQSAVLKAFSQLGTLKDPAAVVGWLARITKHTCLDMRKRGGATKIANFGDAEEVVMNQQQPERSGALALADCQVLREEVESLPDNLVVVVTLRHLEGLTVEELAERLGIKPNAARVRLFRAYERLRMSPRLRQLFGWEM